MSREFWVRTFQPKPPPVTLMPRDEDSQWGQKLICARIFRVCELMPNDREYA